MAGMFEVFVDTESHFRFRLKSPDGTVMAVSSAFDDKPAAVAGIAAVRECAGMGLVTDLCPVTAPAEPAPAATTNPASAAVPAASLQACDDKRVPVIRMHAVGYPRATHRQAPAPHRTGAA